MLSLTKGKHGNGCCPSPPSLQVATPEFQGVLGPTLFAEVGQTLEIVFQVRRTEHWGETPFVSRMLLPSRLEHDRATS